MSARRLATVATFSLIAASASFGQAGTGFTITHGDAVFRQADGPTSGTGTGVTSSDFRVTGAAGTDNLFQNWWWFRVDGQTRETAFFNQVGATVVAGNTATQNWNFGQFTAALTYTVTDTGTASGRVDEVLVITNTSTAGPLILNLMNYTDYDLNGTSGTDNAVLLGGSTIRVTDGVNADFEGIGANVGYRVGAFSSTRLGLSDALVDNAANTGLPFGPGDFSGFWQWRLDIPTGGSITLGERLEIIPAPGTLALLGLGTLATVRRRR